MTECWNQDPDERPSFQRLYNRLDDMLEEQEEYFNWDNHDETKYYYSKQASKTVEGDELGNLEVANLPDVSTVSFVVQTSCRCQLVLGLA